MPVTCSPTAATVYSVRAFRGQSAQAGSASEAGRFAFLGRNQSVAYSPTALLARTGWASQILSATYAASASITAFFGRTVNLIATADSLPAVSRWLFAGRTRSNVIAIQAENVRRNLLFRTLSTSVQGAPWQFQPGQVYPVSLTAVVGTTSAALEVIWNMALGAAANTVAGLATFFGNARLLEAILAAGAVVSRRARPFRTAITTVSSAALFGIRKRGVRTLPALEASFGGLAALWRRPITLTSSIILLADQTRLAMTRRALDIAQAAAAALVGLKEGTFIALTASVSLDATLARLVSARPVLLATQAAEAVVTRFVLALRAIGDAYAAGANLVTSAQSAASLLASQATEAATATFLTAYRTLGAAQATFANTLIGIGGWQITLDAVAVFAGTTNRVVSVWRSVAATVMDIGLVFGRWGFFPFQQPLTVRSLVAERTLREV